MSRLGRAQQGVLLVVAAMACFAVLDTMAKYVSTAVPLVVAMWSRYMFQALFTGGVLLPQRGRALFKTRHPWLQLLRGLLLALTSPPGPAVAIAPSGVWEVVPSGGLTREGNSSTVGSARTSMRYRPAGGSN